MLEDEIKISDKPDENKIQAEQNFYNKKMKNITEGEIYKLVYNLCQSFCRGNDYKVNRYSKQGFNDSYQQKYKAFQMSYREEYKTFKSKSNIFQSPNFCGLESPSLDNYITTNKTLTQLISSDFISKCEQFNNEKPFEPFVFFEMVDPTKFAENFKNKPEGIVNYVKQFANYLKQLLDNAGFIEFLISNDENIKILEQIVTSDFVTKGDEKNPELFRDSNLLFVGSQLVNKYYLYVRPDDDETADYKKMKKEKVCPLILNYLKKSSAISNEALQVLLFKSSVYEIFAEHEGIGKTVIEAIKKTDFHNYSFGTGCNSINGLNELLKKCEQNQSDNEEDCFYNKHRKKIEDALANECAEIFADPEENKKMILETLTGKYQCNVVYEFMSNYLSMNKQKNSETAKKLIDGLKKWLDNESLLLWESHYKSKDLNKYTTLELFSLDNNLKKSFDNACSRTIKHLIDKDVGNNLMKCQEELENIKTTSKSFLDKFSIVLEDYDLSEEPYKTHGKNIAWLSLWIFLTLMCIAIITVLFTLLSINVILKVIMFLMVLFCLIFKIFPEAFQRGLDIHNDLVYNAKLDIYKSKTKDEAENKLSWDMSKIKEVKSALNNKFPAVGEKNNENKNLIDV